MIWSPHVQPASLWIMTSGPPLAVAVTCSPRIWFETALMNRDAASRNGWLGARNRITFALIARVSALSSPSGLVGSFPSATFASAALASALLFETSQTGMPPISNPLPTCGPRRTVQYIPAFPTRSTKCLRSLSPLKSKWPGRGSCLAHTMLVSMVFSPASFAA